jgi:hypothetical protein
MHAPKKRSLEAMQGQDCHDIGLQQCKRSFFEQRQVRQVKHSSRLWLRTRQQQYIHQGQQANRY